MDNCIMNMNPNQIKKPTDYNKSIIYTIRCRDPTITDFYIGTTTNEVRRYDQHKSAFTQKYNLPLYNYIRSNNGWENFEMKKLKDFPCNNSQELHAEEERLRLTMGATLNKSSAYGLKNERHRKKMARASAQAKTNAAIGKKHRRLVELGCIYCRNKMTLHSKTAHEKLESHRLNRQDYWMLSTH
jgi:hypothetical protein